MNRHSESRNIITAFTRTKAAIRSFVLNLTAKSPKKRSCSFDRKDLIVFHLY
ncbi:hypothetical protein WN51_14066 [Melipona quadrifasciata]|uniref:Uncharacterized protein n=1 Tax=Melipona quadrifasciata TaxID=166423 RepID=A0A0M8ZZB5_9HYME|nr:hypothetical protein WN51_14066 [Melipona quadrifasciata]